MSGYSAIAAALLCTAAVPAAAQTPTVTARIEPDSIGIGDRFDYVIDVEKDMVQVVCQQKNVKIILYLQYKRQLKTVL